jgi:hypothetical protein
MGVMRASALCVLGAILAFSASACSTPSEKKPEPLATVAPVLAGSLPTWITSISPTGETKSGAQILIRFENDLVPLEQLESADRTDLIAHFRLDPPVPGRFTVWTPRMVGFVGDAPLPSAARFRVTLARGLKDRKGNALAADYAWTFTTEPLSLSASGSGISETTKDLKEPVGAKPEIEIDSTVELDEASLLQHARIGTADSSEAPLELEAAPTSSPSATPAGEAPGPVQAENTFAYRVVPKSDLALQTTYRLTVAPGVLPLHGNLPSAQTLSAYFRTHGPLTLEGVTSYDPALGDEAGHFVTGAPQLQFSNALDETGALAALSVVPAPVAGVPLARLSDDDRAIEVNQYALLPATHYTLTVAAGIKDVFGQTLDHAVSGTFDTGDLQPDLWAPDGLSIFPSGAPIALNVTTTNLPERHYRTAFRTLDPKALVTLDPTSSDAALAFLPAPEHWPLQAAILHRNEPVDTAIPLREKLGGASGMLAYGVRARTYLAHHNHGNAKSETTQITGFVQLTNVGAFAQWFPQGGMVRLAHLSDGSPIAGAKVEIYESLTDRIAKPNVDASQPPCASGATGTNGVLTLDRAAFGRCASTATSASAPPELLVIAHDGKDWGYVRTQRWSDYAGIGTGWSAGAPNSHGTIVCDRQLYQPGERAEFSAIGYFETNGILARGRAPDYAVSITDPNGKTTALGSRVLDSFGAFAIDWTVGKRAPVGYYAIAAKASNGEEIDGSFQVAEFKPPNFKVALEVDAQTVDAGATVNASSTSTYLFGAPVEGGTTKFYVTRSRAYFNPKGWDAFSFGREWWYPEDEPTLSSDVLQKDVIADASGKAAVAFQVANDLPFATTYQIDAETTDASNLSVSDGKAIVGLPSDKLIGLRGEFLATAGKAYTLGVIVSDPGGKALSGERVHLTLQRRESVSATQLVAGSETPHDAVHYVDVAQADVVSADTPQTATLTPDKPGTYRVRANFGDAKDDATATDSILWVTGPGSADWGPSEQNYLTIKLDKESYRPGDIATALVESPYPDADLYFAVIRHGVLYQQTIRANSSTPQVRFTVTPDMLPNAAVEALVVRRGSPLSKGVPAGLDKLARVGFQPFDVKLDAKYLSLKVSAQHAKLEPGGTQEIGVRLRDAAGKPVQGEVVLAVVDDAVLQLSGYRFPDLVKIVYADQPISTSFADNRRDVTLATQKQPLDKGFGFGGGAMAGPPGTRVRTLFKPLAYWNGGLRTGPDGTASVTFVVPDDLTSWHVMAFALSKDARFGNAEATFVATKALVTNPILPQFARPGDRFSAGVAVTDVARKGGDYSIDAKLAGDLVFVDGDKRSTEQTLSGQTNALNNAFRFNVLVTGPLDGRATIATKLGGNSDAFAVPVTVGTEAATETTVQTGTTKDRATVPIDIVPDFPMSIGGLDVTLASTLLADASEPSRALDEPRPVFAVSLGSRIAIAADTLELGRLYGIDAARATRIRNIANGDIEALRTLALPDGGFADWPGAKQSQLFSTAFIATQLYQAQQAGFAVGGDLEPIRKFLVARLADPDEDCGKNDRTCRAETRLEALETLVFLGEKRDDYLAEIYAQREVLGYYERVELARVLLALPDWRARGHALRDKLLEQVTFTAQNASLNTLGDFGETVVDGQAQLLLLLIASGAPGEDLDRVLTTLLASRQDGRWGCLCDDAEAMNALLAYARTQGQPPDFDALARVGEMTISAQFRGYAKTSVQQTIPMARLPKGQSDVGLSKTGSGTLHYVVALRYGVLVDTPGIYNGIRIDRFVRAAGSDPVLASFGLGKTAAATLAAAKVYDIEDRVTTDHALQNVVVEDPLPGGLEAIDSSFATSTKYYEATESSWQLDYQAIYRDHVLAFAADLPAGVYAFHYLVRSVTPGDFIWPGARVSLQFAPDQFGRTAGTRVTIAAAP